MIQKFGNSECLGKQTNYMQYLDAPVSWYRIGKSVIRIFLGNIIYRSTTFNIENKFILIPELTNDICNVM